MGRGWLLRVAASVAVAVVLAGCGGGSGGTPTTASGSPASGGTASGEVSSSDAAPSSSPAPSSSAPAGSTAVTSISANPVTSTSGAASSTPPPRPTTDPLTGGAISSNPVVAVKIDNTAAAFPQFGIAAADIVYVEQVEGGLTRLIAVYHSTLPTRVGPTRSARTTDVELLQSYGTPLLVFSGAKTAIIDMVKASPIIGTSTDNGYRRLSGRSAPYNLVADLPQIVAQHPGQAPARSNGMVFTAADPRVAAGPAVTKISVTMLAGQTSFTYQGGRYRVLHHGSPYQDASGGTVAADNVLVQNVIDVPDGFKDVIGSPSYLSRTVGTGTFTLYRNGHAIAGTWKRATPADPTQFLDAAGNPVPFKPGKTWVVLAPQTSKVSTS